MAAAGDSNLETAIQEAGTMNWFIFFGWVIFGLYGFGMLAKVAMIGKPKEPVTPNEAIVTIIFHALIMWWLLKAIELGG